MLKMVWYNLAMDSYRKLKVLFNDDISTLTRDCSLKLLTTLMKRELTPQISPSEDHGICFYWSGKAVYCEIDSEGHMNVDQVFISDESIQHNEKDFTSVDEAVDWISQLL
jgi:hypothetical protein